MNRDSEIKTQNYLNRRADNRFLKKLTRIILLEKSLNLNPNEKSCDFSKIEFEVSSILKIILSNTFATLLVFQKRKEALQKEIWDQFIMGMDYPK